MVQAGARGKATKPLPTWRVTFGKQIEILRAYAAVCGRDPRPVSNSEVAGVIGLRPDTISLCNSFFAALGLLTRTEGGYTPNQEIMAYAHAYEWQPESAFHKLLPVIESAWFSEALMPRLRYGSLPVEVAIADLAAKASVGPNSRDQLEMVLDYMESAGIIARENGSIKLAKSSGRSIDSNSSTLDHGKPPSETGEKQPGGNSSEQVSTLFSRKNEGAIRLSIDIQVDMNEMAKWKPERISAFLSGLAQVLAAKGEIEKTESSQPGGL